MSVVLARLKNPPCKEILNNKCRLYLNDDEKEEIAHGMNKNAK